MNLLQSRPCVKVRPASAVELVATLDELPAAGVGECRRLSDQVTWLRVRADLVGDLSPGWLRQEFGGRLLYALGGHGRADGDDAADQDRRRRLIAAAAEGYDLVELDAEKDLGEETLEAIPPEKRLIGWRGTAASASELASIFRRLAVIEARVYLLVVHARRVSDGLVPLSFLRSAGRRDVIAYADGEMGLWSRLLAPRLGAPWIFAGRPGGGRETPEDPSPERLIRDFGPTTTAAVDRICGIAGAAAARSLSPCLHNAAYRALGYPGMFLPFPVNSFAEFWRDFVESGALDRLGLPLQGLTVASPNKEAAASTVALCSRASRRSASANLVFRLGQRWAAATTDPAGVLANLDRRTIPGQRVAVIGCGGSGRAIASALSRSGAAVTLVNRCRERGELASRVLGLPFACLSGFSAEGYDLIVNATPVGSRGDALPFSLRSVAREAVVVDLVYAPETTPLIASALACGLRVVDGREILRAQVERQFNRMTGLALPSGLVAERLGMMPIPSAG
jgi:3-dehydroquinate dehydratase/shikimate dehydrogenase